MAKDPAFLFYPGDWVLGTMGFTLEEKGAYMELMMMQFSFGKFTKAQAEQVLGICFSKCFSKIEHKFSTDGTHYWNDRLQLEIDKRKKFSMSRRNNALGKNKELEAEAYAKHMENVNENVNISHTIVTNHTEKNKTSIIDIYLNDLPNSQLLEDACRNTGISKELFLAYIPEFKKRLRAKYKDFYDFVDHFKYSYQKKKVFETPNQITAVAPASFKPFKKP